MSSNSAYDALMDEIAGMGFCGCIKNGRPIHVGRLIPSSGPVTADQFAEWVFLADDMNPNSERKSWRELKDRLRNAFVRHMGGEVVDASLLRWSFAAVEKPPPNLDPLYRKFEVWRRISSERMLRYNCVQHLQSGEYGVLTADWIHPDKALDEDQTRYFVEALFAFDRNDPAPRSWSTSLEVAIAAHDAAFEN